MPVSQLQKTRTASRVNADKITRTRNDHSTKGEIATTASLVNNVRLGQPSAISFQEQQSQKLAQELISAAIGCITYLRGLIPEDSFCDMAYGTAEDNFRYFGASQESNCDDVNKKKKKRESSTRIKVIQHGISNEADTLLAWIEQGIFVALRMGYLRGFQLAIFLDKEKSEDIQEAYTFSINYKKNESGKNVSVDGLVMTDVLQDGHSITMVPEVYDISHVRKSVKAVLRRLIVITQTLEALPDDRYITIRLYHTADTPKGWAPPNFAPAYGDSFRFPTESSGLRDETFGCVDTGLHRVHIRVTSSKRALDKDGSDHGADDLNSAKRSRIEKIVEAHTFIVDNITVDPMAPYTKQNGVDDPIAKSIESAQDDKKSEASEKVGVPNSSRSEEMAEDLTRAPAIDIYANTSPGGYQELQCWPPQLVVNDEAGSSAEFYERSVVKDTSIPGSQIAQYKMRLNRFKAAEAEAARGNGIDRNIQDVEEKNQAIQCECGGTSRDKAMIECDICRQWQHCECYGFRGANDARIGDYHMCYTCLLGKTESHILANMATFALGRQIIRYLERSKAPRSLYDISKWMGIDSLRITKVLSSFVSKQFLIVKNHRKSATKRSPDKYVINERPQIKKSIEDEVLDPLINVAQHYDFPESCIKMLDILEETVDSEDHVPSSLQQTSMEIVSQLQGLSTANEEHSNVVTSSSRMRKGSSSTFMPKPSQPVQKTGGGNLLGNTPEPSGQTQMLGGSSARRTPGKYKASDAVGILKAGNWS